MPLPRNHNENLNFSCVYCLDKYKSGENARKPLQLQPISDIIKKKIVEHVYQEYNENQNVLPQKVCAGCTIKLRMLGTKTERKMEKPPDYHLLVASALSVPPERRSEIGYKCYCYICNVTAYNSICHKNAPNPTPVPSAPTAGPSRPPPPRPPPPRVPTSPSQQVVVDLPPPNSPPSSPPPEVGFISPPRPKRKSIFDGLTNTQTWDELMKLSPLMRECLATDLLDDYIREAKAKGLSSFKMSRRNGRKFEYHINEKAEGAFVLSMDVISEIRNRTGLSTNKLVTVKEIMKAFGAKCETYMKPKIFQQNRRLKDFFVSTHKNFICKEVYDLEDPDDFSLLQEYEDEYGEEEEDEEEVVGATGGPAHDDDILGLNDRIAIMCNDVPGLIQYLVEARQLDEDATVQIGLDGGGSFLKVGLLLRENNTSESSVTSPRKRFKSGGVKKLIVLYLVQNVPENYYNIMTILEDLNLKTIAFSLACDLKLLNISK